VLLYNTASGTLRFEYPNSWDVETITDVKLSITDKTGATLLAATSATEYVATKLETAATAGARTITLKSTAGTLARGDRLRIALPDEDVTVESYNSTTKVATLRDSLLMSHEDEAAVSGMWSTYALNTSATTTFTAGLEVVLTWDPNNYDSSVTELAYVQGSAMAVMEYRERFAALYPTEYEIAETRLDSVYAEAMTRLKYRLQGRNMNLNKVIDQGIFTPALLDYMRWLITLSGGNAFASEREAAWAAFLQSEESLCSQPVWVDDNEDLVEDAAELEVHEPWRRARGL
jgi:hypothetical protein